MRNPTWPLIFLLLACSDIAPVDTVDLCKGDDPPSDSCGQCKTAPYAAECPKCRRSTPDPKCANASDRGGGDGGNGTGGSGNGGIGSGGSGSGGTDAMVQDGGSGTGGVGAAGTGGTGGSGSGGSAPCGTCPTNKPQCLDTECVECVDGADCAPSTPQCHPFMHTCVECFSDDQCKSQGKVCDEKANTCVPCEIDKDCKDTEFPQCKDHECKRCTDQTACDGRKGKEHCDTGTSSPTKGQCVECLAHGDCKNPEPQCSTTRKCVACSKDEACLDREDETVCDTDNWSESQGSCVECTGTKYAACKDGNTEYVCDSQERKCSTSHKKGTTTGCSPCVSDAECLSGLGCAQQALDDSTAYCFPIDGSGNACANANSLARPYSHSTLLTSIDHTAANYCLPSSTCPAYLDTGNTCAMTSDCGDGDGDGLCISSSHATVPNKCSYICNENYDCPGSGSFTVCDGPTEDTKFCQPP